MRRYLGTDKEREQVKSLLLKEQEGWRKERLVALKMGMSACNSLKHISDATGRSVATIQRWFCCYRKEGLEGLLKRGFKGRTHTYCNEDIRAYLLKGLECGRWNTVVQAQRELEAHFHRTFTYHNVWNWIKKFAGVLRIPRPVHEKRDPAKAEAFKHQF